MPFYKSLRAEHNRWFAERAIDRLVDLRKQLKRDVPTKTARDTLLLATWNIRDFDSNKFGQGPRLDESYYYIAEIIAAFDLVAVQEVNEDIGPLKRVMRILGPNWDFIVTDVTEGSGGNGERLAYVYDRRKILFRNIAGEIVLPMSKAIGGQEVEIRLPRGHQIKFTKDTTLTMPDGTVVDVEKDQSVELPLRAHKVLLPEGQKTANYRQFARTPFLVAFQAGWFKFSLCTVHLYYGSSSGEGYRRRVKEIGAIAQFFKERSDEHRKLYRTGENYILLGDFNIVGPDDDTMEALEKHGFSLPPRLFKSNMKRSKYYDQIAFMVKEDELQMGPSMDEDGEAKNNGVLDFYESVFRDADKDYEVYHDLMKNTEVRDVFQRGRKKGQNRNAKEKRDYYLNEWRTWQLSDHLPLWVELKIDFSDAYLKRIKEEVLAAGT